MINAMVWCLITVTLSGAKVETAAKGKVIKSTDNSYYVDFSQYARQQGYEGTYYYYKVDKYECFQKGED